MLRWDEVRRLIVQHLAPSVEPLGFGRPGRTMRRFRGPFTDVIDFRCGRYSTFQLAFGCGLRPFLPLNPKPWNCAFRLDGFHQWPQELFEFQQSAEEQVAGLVALRPLFLAEVQRWYGLLADVRAARVAADTNHWGSPNAVGAFSVPSPNYTEILRQLDAVLAR